MASDVVVAVVVVDASVAPVRTSLLYCLRTTQHEWSVTAAACAWRPWGSSACKKIHNLMTQTIEQIMPRFGGAFDHPNLVKLFYL